MSRITRADHVRWAKDRAFEYLDRDDVKGAIGSMLSDLSKHPDTERAVPAAFVSAMLGPADLEAARRWIEGFAE